MKHPSEDHRKAGQNQDAVEHFEDHILVVTNELFDVARASFVFFNTSDSRMICHWLLHLESQLGEVSKIAISVR
jgi:hypothetical protein